MMTGMSQLERADRSHDAAPASRSRTRLSSKKLLRNKWTAVTPLHKEKHFVVIRVIEPELPDARIDRVEVEAIHSTPPTGKRCRHAKRSTGVSMRKTVGELVEGPEATLGIFALLLNFPWEMLQAPLFADMRSSPHATAAVACLQATFGDMVIMLIAHAVVAIRTRDRRWVMAASGMQLMLFVGVGLSITALVEWLATRGLWVSNWTYAATMPLLPGTGIGLAPIFQWLLLPLLTVWFARRHLSGSQA